MVKISLACRKCKRKTRHAVFKDDYNLPDEKALVQCYECEAMGIEILTAEQIEQVKSGY